MGMVLGMVGLVEAGAESRLALVDNLLVAVGYDREEYVSDEDADGDETDEGPSHAADACSAG